jgi:hypothetical protein
MILLALDIREPRATRFIDALFRAFYNRTKGPFSLRMLAFPWNLPPRGLSRMTLW